jgi:hypothetical protein
MRNVSIYAVVIITMAVMFRYLWLLKRREIKPALAMWLFFSVAIIMSFVTYMAEGKYSFADNIMNAIDIVYVITVFLAILIYGDKSSKLTMFDMGCLIAVLIIALSWIFTQNHKLTNILIQAILVIAYFPVIKRLFDSKENTESFTVWTGMLLAPAIALISSRGLLAQIYSIRAIICVSILLIIMLRIQVLSNRRKRMIRPSDAKYSELNY